MVRETGARSRLDASASVGLTELVDREQEIALLAERWSRVRQGSGQVVLICGESGIGKSRLVRVLKERVASEGHLWLECYCSPYYQSSPLHAVIDLLTQGLGWTRQDSPETKLATLEQALARAGFAVSDVLPPLAGLLSLPLPAGSRRDPCRARRAASSRRSRRCSPGSRAWQPSGRWCWSSRTCTGSIPRRWSSSACSSNARRPCCSCSPPDRTSAPPWPMHAHVTQLT